MGALERVGPSGCRVAETGFRSQQKVSINDNVAFPSTGDGNGIMIGLPTDAIALAEGALKLLEPIGTPEVAKVRAQLAEWRKTG